MDFFGIKYLIKYFRDALFPARCLICKKEGDWVCDLCLKLVDISGIFINHHVAITEYGENKPIGLIVKNWKYNYITELNLVIEKLINNFFSKNTELFKNIDLIVPVPLHRKRLAERGFNQSEIIAKVVGKKINKPVELVLFRTRNTPHQARLDKVGRLVNVKEAFVATSLVWGKNVLLVDDIFTTGATINECKKALQIAGAKEVWSFTLAKGY